jgi:hypothetical protein
MHASALRSAAFLFTTCLTLLALAATGHAAESPSPGDRVVILKEDFEAWVWRPIMPIMMAAGREALAEGRSPGYEHKGPLYRAPKLFLHQPAGSLVQGTAAWQGGCSTRLVGPCEVGYHDRFANLFEPGKEYDYEAAVKGRGVFRLRASVGGTDAVGRFAWLGFPELIAAPVTGEWQVVRGRFRVPDFPEQQRLNVQARASASIVVAAGEEIFLDDLILTAAPTDQAP